MIYRGYDIEQKKKEGWRIMLDGKVLCWQPSEQFAQKWVDKEKREQAEKKREEK